MSRRLPPYRSSPLARDPLHKSLADLDDEDVTNALSPGGVSTRLPIAYPRSRAEAETRLMRASVEELPAALEDDDLETNLVDPRSSVRESAASQDEDESCTHALPAAPVARPQRTTPFPPSARFDVPTDHFSAVGRLPIAERPSAPPFTARQRRSTSVPTAASTQTPLPRHVQTQSRLSSRSGPVDLFEEASLRSLHSRPVDFAPPPVPTRSWRGNANALPARSTPSAPVAAQPPSERPQSQDVSVNNPWTFPTGAPPRSTSVITAKTAPFGSKMHVIGASIVMLVSLAVLIASAISVHSSTRRDGATQAVAASAPAANIASAQASATQVVHTAQPVQMQPAQMQPAQPAQMQPAQAAPTYVPAAAPSHAAAAPVNAPSYAAAPAEPAVAAVRPAPRAPAAMPRPATPAAPKKSARDSQATSLEQMMSDDMLR